MDLQFDSHPPIFVGAGTADELCESSRIFAKRLTEGAGVVLHKEYEGEKHGFFNFGKSPSTAELRADILAFLAEQDPA